MIVAMLEARRHPELMAPEDDPLVLLRGFVTRAFTDTPGRNGLAGEADQDLVEAVVAVLTGLAFYAGFIGSAADTVTAGAQLRAMLPTWLG